MTSILNVIGRDTTEFIIQAEIFEGRRGFCYYRYTLCLPQANWEVKLTASLSIVVFISMIV